MRCCQNSVGRLGRNPEASTSPQPLLPPWPLLHCGGPLGKSTATCQRRGFLLSLIFPAPARPPSRAPDWKPRGRRSGKCSAQLSALAGETGLEKGRVGLRLIRCRQASHPPSFHPLPDGKNQPKTPKAEEWA